MALTCKAAEELAYSRLNKHGPCRNGSCNLARLGSQYPGWKLRSNIT
uniref:Uncharacterized protein n=1 Tax=Caenorhabditis japonica TaxID=281687 RepID=A0A8R1IB30_CAEJA